MVTQKLVCSPPVSIGNLLERALLWCVVLCDIQSWINGR